MMRLILVFISLFSLAACQVYKSEIPSNPAGAVPAAFQEDDRGGGRVAPGFWHAFADPLLNRFEEEALANNQTIAQAKARLEEAAARSEIAGAGLFPWLNLKGRAAREKQMSSFGASTGNSYNLSLAAGYEIDLWKRLSSSRSAAELGHKAAALDLAAARTAIAAQVADLYFLIVETQAQLNLSDEMIGSYTDSLERVSKRYESGLVPALDVYQARQNLLAVQARKPSQEAVYTRAVHGLAVLLGRFPEEFTLAAPGNMCRPEKLFAAGLPANLVAARPDIRAALLRLIAADRQTAAAVADRFPTFNLLAEFGRGRIDFGQVVSDSFWSIATSALAPIFDAGRRKAEVAAKRAATMAALAAYRQTVLSAFREVEDSLTSLAATRRSLSLLEERERTASETLKLAEDRYYQGLSDYLPVLSAQQQYFAVKGELLAARQQMVSANITLARAAYLTGGGPLDRPVE